MIIIKAENSNEAWRKTLVEIFKSGVDTDNQKYYKDELTLIEIDNPKLMTPDELFPMDKTDLEIIYKYITSGEHENKVIHEWSKIYRHRIYDQPNSQFDFFIKKLKEKLPVGETQISIWDKSLDQTSKITPCTQIIWGRIKHGKLEFHVHANSSNAYNKLLLNIQEFIAMQNYVADILKVQVGKYFHFIDSCHIYHDDLEKVKELVKLI